MVTDMCTLRVEEYERRLSTRQTRRKACVTVTVTAAHQQNHCRQGVPRLGVSIRHHARQLQHVTGALCGIHLPAGIRAQQLEQRQQLGE